MPRNSNQLSLSLRPFPRWGGRREGAGRKRSAASGDLHRRRAPLASRHPCHVTLKLRRGIPSLRRVRFVRDFENGLRAIRSRNRFRVVHYSIQSDHVHLIVEAASVSDLSCGMKAVGARLARSVHRIFAQTGAVLAERFHLHVLRTPCEVRSAIAYVLLNARRHLAKLGRRLDPLAPLDPASSGRWFDGWRRHASVEAAAAPGGGTPPTRVPRTWLLAVGWRRHGLIDGREVPGAR